MSSRDYWKAREETQRQKNIAQEAEYSRRIQDIYTKMYQNIQDDINSFYVKYADAEGITLAEAKRRISKLDIEEYAAKAKRYVEQAAKDRAANGGKTDYTAAYFSDKANAEMRLYNATMKINRLELLKAQLGLEMIDGHDELEKLFGDALSQRTLDEFKRQAGILGSTVLNNEKLAHSIVNASFHNAKFSDRVWMAQDLMKYRLNAILTQELIKGLNPKVLASRLMPLIKKEILENKRAAAERLLRTELCRVQIDAQMKSYERNGYDKYIFLAEPTACPHCRKLDNKVFAVKDAMPGENAPPAHPNCRCSTAAYAESDAEYEKWFKETTGEHSAQWELEQGMASTDILDSQKDYQEKLLNKDYDITKWHQVKSLVKGVRRKYNDVTELWKPKYEADVENCEKRFMYRGEIYTIDGINVQFDPSKEEKAAAKLLSEVTGEKVVLMPRIHGKYIGIETPDMIIAGTSERWDLKGIEKDGKDAVRNIIKRKKKQAENFLIDISKSKLTKDNAIEQAKNVFHAYNTRFVKRIILIQDHEIVKVFERE